VEGCDHTKLIWLPVETAQGRAMALVCRECQEIQDVMHDDEPLELELFPDDAYEDPWESA
jgi:hypothetical protein